MLQLSPYLIEYKIIHPTKKAELVRIEIPDSVQNVGLMYSGGVDSTFLLTLLQLHRKKFNRYALKAFTVDKSENYEYYSEKILQLEFYSGVERFTKIPNQREDGVIKEGIGHVLQRDDVDLVFTGVNRIPEVYIGESGPVRDSLEFIAQFPKLRCPFHHLTKDYTVLGLKNLQKEFIGVDVFSMTHTCTAAKVACGECWFCKERAWAVSMLG